MKRKNFLLSLLGLPVVVKSILSSNVGRLVEEGDEWVCVESGKVYVPAPKKLTKVKKIRLVPQNRCFVGLPERGELPTAGGDRFEEYETWEYK